VGEVSKFEADFDCPWCGQGYSVDADVAIYADGVETGETETCSECGKKFAVVCVDVCVELDSHKVFSGEEAG
jgi:transcription elongation factor Elf1